MENNCFQITKAYRLYRRSGNRPLFVLVFLLLGLCQSATTHAQNLVWATSFRGPDYKFAKSTVDGLGKVYTRVYYQLQKDGSDLGITS